MPLNSHSEHYGALVVLVMGATFSTRVSAARTRALGHRRARDFDSRRSNRGNLPRHGRGFMR